MHFWSLRKLGDDLRLERLTPRQTFSYLLVGTIMTLVEYFFVLLFQRYPSGYNTIVLFLLDILTIVTGLVFLFWTFPKSHKKHFIEWYIPLMVPMNMRLIIAFLVLFIVFRYLLASSGYFSNTSLRILSWINAFFNIIVYVVFFLRMAGIFKKIAKGLDPAQS